MIHATLRRFFGLSFSVLALLASLTTLPAAARNVSPLPGDLGSIQNFRTLQGNSLYFLVTGATAGSLWGSNPYTDDSTLEAAAVHAGVLRAGQTGVVKVTPGAGLTSYKGSTSNGVTSGNYGSYLGSYTLAADDGGDNPLLPGPSSLVGYRAAPAGSVYLFDVTGTSSGSVWGTNAFTDDSTLSSAAVHAGVLKAGQRGTVRVVMGSGVQTYAGSLRNGVQSRDYSSWKNNYAVSDAGGAIALHAYPGMPDNPLPAPGNLSGYTAMLGASLYFNVTGAASGSLWGTGIYTADSTLAKAVVHAGLAASGQTLAVKTTIKPGQQSYTASTSNGVTSSAYGSYSLSYAVTLPDDDLGAIPRISGTLTANGEEGKAFSYAVSATPAPTVYAASGLPEGLSIDAATGRITGTPKVSGKFRVQLLVSNAAGTSNADLTLTFTGTGSATASSLTSSADCFFNWAEKQFPILFVPAQPASQTLEGFYYRHYRTSNSYLAVYTINRHVFYIGEASANTPLDIGDIAGWLKNAGCPAVAG